MWNSFVFYLQNNGVLMINRQMCTCVLLQMRWEHLTPVMVRCLLSTTEIIKGLLLYSSVNVRGNECIQIYIFEIQYCPRVIVTSASVHSRWLLPKRGMADISIEVICEGLQMKWLIFLYSMSHTQHNHSITLWWYCIWQGIRLLVFPWKFLLPQTLLEGLIFLPIS